MEYNKEDIKRLTAQVEKMVGKKISGPRDFDFLSRQVEGYTGETLSVSTLKRVWGYIPSGSRLSRYSLDVLARMAGYAGWEAYVAGGNGGDVSFRIVHRKLFTDSLEYGDRVKLVWSPDRVVTTRYEGQNMFTVVESENSKLCVGDTFRCGLFVVVFTQMTQISQIFSFLFHADFADLLHVPYLRHLRYLRDKSKRIGERTVRICGQGEIGQNDLMDIAS